MAYDGGGLGPSIDSIEVLPSPATMDASGLLQLTATIHYAAGPPSFSFYTAWLSSDDTIAEVNSSSGLGGLVVARDNGTVSVGFYVSYMVPPPPGPYDGSDLLQPYPGEPDYDPDEFPSPFTRNWITGWTEITVSPAPPPPPDPDGRFLLAFDDALNVAYPTWTRIDSTDNLVASYTIDRGRSYELDRTDTGRATVQITDTTGVLDPTIEAGGGDSLLLETGGDELLLEDSSGVLLLEVSPFPHIRPLMQAALGRYDPVAEEWKLRFRGYVEDFSYETDPSQQLNRLTVNLVDQFDVLAAADLWPGQAGTTPPDESAGQIYFPAQRPEDRINRVLTDTGLPSPLRAVLSGHVELWQTVYSAGETPLTVIQEAADGDWPGVSNVFCDRRGRICFHGRQARFDPATVSAGAGGLWEYNTWKVGDGAAITASPSDTAQIRAFGFSRNLTKIINSGSATPIGIDDDDVRDQLVVDATSIGQYGIRSWTATSLLTKTGLADDSTDLVETKRFASYYVANYSQPRDRVHGVTLRSLAPDDARAAANWDLLTTIDIADSVQVTVSLPGGGGFEAAEYFVEGIHEESRPLHPDYDDVTLTLDLSPRAYYTSDPWPA